MPSRIQRSRANRSQRGVRRYDHHGEIRLMAEADGYVMCRRPGNFPFILSWREWSELASKPCDVLIEIANA